MEFKRRSDGKKIYPTDFKVEICEQIANGETMAELSRKHQVPIQNIHKWYRDYKKNDSSSSAHPSTRQVPLSEYKKLEEEIVKLKKALANTALDRDILKEAVETASKKKWI